MLLGATLKSFLLDADLDLMTSKVAKQYIEKKLGVKISKGDDSKEFAQLCLSITAEILKTRKAAAAPPPDSSEDRLLVARTDCHGMAISPRTMPPKRAASEETQAETQAVVKRYRQAIDEVAEEYVCPITTELPIDPVTAEDGRCYERCAIEEWFARQPQPQVKSPVTNELMGKRLFPAVQVRNSLKRLVESGAISGSKADAWKKAMVEEAKVADIRAKAEGGDAVAMRKLGFAYRDGKRGLKADRTQAFMWFKRAADLKDVTAIQSCGYVYLHGKGVEQSNARGTAMVGVGWCGGYRGVGARVQHYGRGERRGPLWVRQEPAGGHAVVSRDGEVRLPRLCRGDSRGGCGLAARAPVDTRQAPRAGTKETLIRGSSLICTIPVIQFRSVFGSRCLSFKEFPPRPAPD